MADSMQPTATPLVDVSELHKRYDTGTSPVRALRGIDLSVAAGEFVSVVGPSGCGKSTLLQLIAGLDVPTAGSVAVAGQALAGLGEAELAVMRRQHVGFVFQFAGLLGGMTALENVALPALIAGTPRAAALRRGRDLLDLLGIERHAASLPGALSGGEQQRVALARALANEPSVLLADEPTGALDSESAAEVLELLRRLHATGQSMVLVTHDQAVAEAADRRVNMLDGAIAAA